MKKQLSSILLITVLGILLSSCSNSSKISITKRHYRSGYYVEFGNKPHTSPTVYVAPKVTTPPKRPTVSTAIETKPKVSAIVVNASKAPSEIINPAPKISILRKEIQKNDENIYNSSSPKLSNQNNLTQMHGDNEGAEVRAEVNVSYAVIIICAIFIPPLGVGLMYGINSYFWIDLILTLLFFFPGMIFALIVVLM